MNDGIRVGTTPDAVNDFLALDASARLMPVPQEAARSVTAGAGAARAMLLLKSSDSMVLSCMLRVNSPERVVACLSECRWSHTKVVRR